MVDSGPATPRTKESNGLAINGIGLNGFGLNGFSINGEEVNGFSINGFSINGFSINGFSINGTSFSGTQIIDGQPKVVSGTELIGANLTLIRSGNLYVLTFDNIYPESPGSDVYLYNITVHDLTNNTAGPLCSVNDAPAAAVPLTNYWDLETGDRIDDSSVITFACDGGALFKCLHWGYKPWKEATRCDPDTNICSQVSLKDYHQACTRMVRNDYCGDGTPHTLNGTLIDVYDPLSPAIQVSATTNHPQWGIEAEWGPDGALCAGDSLRLQHLDELGIPYAYPPCLDELQEQPDCGSFPAQRGALVGNSYCGAFGTDPKSCG